MLTDLSKLPIGTQFHVINGDWDGEIMECDGELGVFIHLAWAVDGVESFRPFYPDSKSNTLDIEILNED